LHACLLSTLQAEEEQDSVDAMLLATGYDADAMREGGKWECVATRDELGCALF